MLVRDLDSKVKSHKDIHKYISWDHLGKDFVIHEEIVKILIEE